MTDMVSFRFVQMNAPKKLFDLAERTALYAENIRDFCMELPKNPANNIYLSQLIRSGSSPAANYIEANEGIGEKDFIMKIKTCRREAKESALWLRLILTGGNPILEEKRNSLKQEARELVLIFSAILKKREIR